METTDGWQSAQLPVVWLATQTTEDQLMVIEKAALELGAYA